RVEVLHVPELGAERMLLEHVDMVHALGGMVAEIFDDGAVRAMQVGEAAAARWLHAVRLGFDNLRPGATERAVWAWPGVAGDQHRAAVAGVEREVPDIGTCLV